MSAAPTKSAFISASPKEIGLDHKRTQNSSLLVMTVVQISKHFSQW